jgi:aerobic-type carbon monoxide dehydrogenase small subunit (CoxS/CutS family)
MPEQASESVTLGLSVNGRSYAVSVSAEDSLLDVLRDRLLLFSCRQTCGVGLCGSCAVILDGRAVNSCIAPAFPLDGAVVRTAEGLESATGLSPLQEAFVEEQAFQCSFCTPGFLMSATAMLEEGTGPFDVDDALGGHLCRCGSYEQILAAVRRTLPTGPAPARFAEPDTPQGDEQ